MTKPSAEVVKRYKKKAIMQIKVEVPRKMGEDFRAKCQATGTAQAAVLKSAINKFLEEEP